MHMDFIFCQKLFEKAKIIYFHCASVWPEKGKRFIVLVIQPNMNFGDLISEDRYKQEITAFSKKIFLLVTVEKTPGVTNTINNVYILFRCPSKP